MIAAPQGSTFGLHLAFAAWSKTYLLPPTTMQFRIRWNVWRIESDSKDSAKKDLVEMFKKNPGFFFSLEDASIYDSRRPLWKRFLTGR